MPRNQLKYPVFDIFDINYCVYYVSLLFLCTLYAASSESDDDDVINVAEMELLLSSETVSVDICV